MAECFPSMYTALGSIPSTEGLVIPMTQVAEGQSWHLFASRVCLQKVLIVEIKHGAQVFHPEGEEGC